MNLLATEQVLGKDNSGGNFGPSGPSDCKFEISQASTTFKLRKLTDNTSFKITLKPIVGENATTKAKKSSAKQSKEHKTDGKRSLSQAFGSESSQLLAEDESELSNSNDKGNKEENVSVRKSTRNRKLNPKYDNLPNLFEAKAAKTPKTSKKKDLPTMIADDIQQAIQKEESAKKEKIQEKQNILQALISANLAKKSIKEKKIIKEEKVKPFIPPPKEELPVVQKIFKEDLLPPKTFNFIPPSFPKVQFAPVVEKEKEIGVEKIEENKKLFFASFNKDKPAPALTQKPFLEFAPGEFSKLPLTQNKATRDDFIYPLDIVTNTNQRETIKVSFQPGKVDVFSEIPNPINKAARQSFYNQFNFTTEYRSGYAPVSIQALQEKEFSYKNHFIKKKQSCANGSLKRVCGVSYVKKLETHQLNVDHIFQPLMPLIFQGSSGCSRLSEYEILMQQVSENVFAEREDCYFLVTLFEDEDERVIREYLYYPERRFRLAKGKVYIVRSFDSLWHFFKDKHFICIHLVYSPTEFIKRIEVNGLTMSEVNEALCKSNIQIGILCKRSLSGKKSFLKTFTEGVQFAGEIDELESDDENQMPSLEEHDAKEKKKKELREKKLQEKKEKKERREKEKLLKKETKELEKKKKQELKEQEKLRKEQEKGKNHEEGKKKVKGELYKKKHIHFFDKTKKKLEKDAMFLSEPLASLFSGFDEIMQPYLKMLFVKGFDMKNYHQQKSVVKTDEKMVEETREFVEEIKPDIENVETTPEEHNAESRTGFLESEEILQEREDEPDKDNEEHEEKEIEVQEDCEIECKDEVIEIEQDTKIEEEEEKDKEDHDASDSEKEEEENKEIEKEGNNGTKMEEEIAPVHDPWKDSELYKFVKEIKKDGNKNIITSSIRLELYTQEDSWKSANEHTKNLLYTFILQVTDLMTEKLRNWTFKRNEIMKNNTFSPFSKANKQILVHEFPRNEIDNTIETIATPLENLNWQFPMHIKALSPRNTTEAELLPDFRKAKLVELAELQGIENPDKELPVFNFPLYLINTRDSFAFDLIEKVTELDLCGRKVLKTDYYFDPNVCPSNFKSFVEKFPDYHIGVTTYNNFFSHEELTKIESQCYDTERGFFNNHFFPMTGQMTCTNDKVRRTKFFFGARYMWTKQQLSEPHSMVGAGIRVDVSERPKWIRDLVENPMVEAGILEKDFINSIAMNVYHDGKEGLAQHFDDAVRFKQPIFSLRIFSDSRLSFGSQLYGFCNGAFCIPMPRGCITVLHEESYSANGIKHCVRPIDMSGKSAALILRQMHHKVYDEAKMYDEFVDFPSWFSTLSIAENAVSYSDQKRIEAEELLKAKKKDE